MVHGSAQWDSTAARGSRATARNPVARSSSSTITSVEVAVVSKRTTPVPSGYANSASCTPSIRFTATRAAVAHPVHVIPVTSSATVR